MKIRNEIRRRVGVALRGYPKVRQWTANMESAVESRIWSAAEVFPRIIRPTPFLAMIAITARCNSRCIGCRYGRDFMPGHELSWEMIRDALDDARAAGIYKVRLYGGEPLLHSDLPRIVRHCRDIGITPVVTTNALLLPSKIKELYEAGLRDVTVGFYGRGEQADRYMQGHRMAERVEAGIAAVRKQCGDDVDMQLNWLMMRPTCRVEDLDHAADLARRYQMNLQVDLIHYSLPYFTEGPERELQFRSEDGPAIRKVVDRLVEIRDEEPELIRHTREYLKSVPDWLLKGPDMKVPCTVQRIVWIGADGTVQLCYVTFKLGNLHEKRLRDILFTKEHTDCARRAFKLDCPNCHCESGERVMRHAPTRRRYSK